MSQAVTIEQIGELLDRKLGHAFGEFRGEMDGRFERIDGRFEKIDERFEKMDEKFEKMDERFEKMDGRFESFEKRMDKKFDDFEERLDGKFDYQFSIVHERIDGLDEKFEEFKDQSLSNQDAMMASLERMENEATMRDAWIQRIDEDVQKLKAA